MLSQTDQNIIVFVFYGYQIIKIITLWLCLRTIMTMIIWFLEHNEHNKPLRYGIFLMDAFCFLRMLSGLVFCRVWFYGYMILCNQDINIPGLIKQTALFLGIFLFSCFIKNKTCTIEEYYKENK